MIKVEDICCGYNNSGFGVRDSGFGDGFFLKDISFKVGNGEFFGIIGPNGGGKTTLLRAISKVIPIKKGRVMFSGFGIQGSEFGDGMDIKQIAFKDFARNVAVVSQISEIAFDMRVEELILLGRIPHQNFFLTTKKDIEIAEKSMEITGIINFREKYISKLSGGERQLVFIARALCQEPKLLFLDEPTTHLDITHQVRILNLIKRLNRELSLTVCIVLHDLNLASEYCDRLLLLSEGKIHKIGRPSEVLTYQTIEEVYKTIVVVKENPISNKPYIFLVSK